MPNATFRINLVKRSEDGSAVSAAAYQTGDHLYSRRDREVKYEGPKEELILKEIFLPPHAPPEFADRETLWNSVEAVEKNWNSQLARRMKIALPIELSMEDNIALAREYVQQEFVSKGMIADLAIHNKEGNPHFHVLLTLRPLDENGKWMAKAHKVPFLDKEGNQVMDKNGKPKMRKVPTVDWNNRGNAEIWRHDWEVIQNAYLERVGRTERISMKSYERQGIDKIPTVHMGPAVTALERKGIPTDIGDLNRKIIKANEMLSSLKRFIKEVKSFLEQVREVIRLFRMEPKEVYLIDLLNRKFDERNNERELNWKSQAGIERGGMKDLQRYASIISYMKEKKIFTLNDLEGYMDGTVQQYETIRADIRSLRKQSKEIQATIKNMDRYHELQPLHDKHSSIFFKMAKDRFYSQHKAKLDEWSRLNRFTKKKFPDLSQYDRQEFADRQTEIDYRLSDLETRELPLQEELSMLKEIQWLIKDLIPELDPEYREQETAQQEEHAQAPAGRKKEVKERPEPKPEPEPQRETRAASPVRKTPSKKPPGERRSVKDKLNEKKERLREEGERGHAQRGMSVKKSRQDKDIG